MVLVILPPPPPYITVTLSSGRLEWSLCTLCRVDPRSLQVTRREPVATLRLQAAYGSGVQGLGQFRLEGLGCVLFSCFK